MSFVPCPLSLVQRTRTNDKGQRTKDNAATSCRSNTTRRPPRPAGSHSGTSRGSSTASRTRRAKPFTIVIPPPNVTGALHMGHALNNTLQDVLDPLAAHAGLQRRVDARHRSRRHRHAGRRRTARSCRPRRRRATTSAARNWSSASGNGRTSTKPASSASSGSSAARCDWQRTRFTLDEGLCRAVRETFFNMFKDG